MAKMSQKPDDQLKSVNDNRATIAKNSIYMAQKIILTFNSILVWVGLAMVNILEIRRDAL